MTGLDLPQKWREKLAAIFTEYAPTFEVWAYGSRVSGHCHEGSDLDLVLIHPEQAAEMRCYQTLEIREALSDSTIPICVDVMDWASIPEEFHRQINTHKVKLFEARDRSHSRRSIYESGNLETKNDFHPEQSM